MRIIPCRSTISIREFLRFSRVAQGTVFRESSDGRSHQLPFRQFIGDPREKKLQEKIEFVKIVFKHKSSLFGDCDGHEVSSFSQSKPSNIISDNASIEGRRVETSGSRSGIGELGELSRQAMGSVEGP